LITAINSGTTAGGWTVGGTYNAKATAAINGSGQLQVSDVQGDISSVVTSATTSNLGQLSSIYGSNNTSTVYIGDGTTTGALNTQISTTINALSSLALNLGSDTLLSSASATTALADVSNAINSVSAQRGVIGASVNRLNAASSNMSSQVTNLQSAANSIQNADIGKTVANMTQYNILQSTGMAALQQSNQAQQAVLKLVQ
jgi:flagellin